MTVLGQGGAPLGDLYEQISHAQAEACLEAAHAAGITLYDTSPWYGLGLSEMRFGLALHRKPRDSFVLQTKLGRDLLPRAHRTARDAGFAGGLRFSYRHEYTAEAFARQLEASLQRHGLGRVDSVVIHDLEPGAAGGGFADGFADPARALARAREHARVCRDGGFALLGARRAAGEIGAIGAGVNAPEQGEDAAAKWAWDREYVAELLSWRADADGRGLDFLLLANTYSLLEHGGLELLDACAAAGVSVVVGGPFSSGILVTGADPPDAATNPPRFNYEPAPAPVRATARALEAACARHGVKLAAAALQFPLAHPAVACVIPGGKSAAEVSSNVELMNTPIPAALWTELKAEGLLPDALPTP